MSASYDDMPSTKQRNVVTATGFRREYARNLDKPLLARDVLERLFMPYVITELCAGTCDTACVSVCPVDCIHGPLPLEDIAAIPHDERAAQFASLQLYIDPDNCICCAACVSECPVSAIFDEDDVPAASRGSIEANAAFFRLPRAT